MILAAHQPFYFPDISFFAKMLHADRFILTDDFAFSTRPAINRTRIKTVAGQDWLSVPVRTKGIKRQLIREVRVKNDAYDWRRKHFKSLQVNYTYAGYFEALEELLRPFFDQAYDNLGAVNLASIKLVRRYLDIRTPMQLTSQLPLQGRGAALLAEMTVLLGCDTFLADSRYREYLSAEVFRQAGVGLQFWDFEARPYHQQFGDFVPGFSVLDLLFNEGREAIQVISGNR